MKKTVKNLVTIFAMLALTIASASTNEPFIKLEKTADKTISFTVDKLAGTVNVSFKDEAGSLIYKETYNTNKVSSRKYNLKEIASGKYYFEVETEVAVEKYLVIVDSKTAEIYKEATSVLHKPMVVLKDNGKVIVTKLNLSKDDLKVSVYDKNGNGLYQETISADNNEYTIGEKFDFSNVKGGEYTFYLKTDNRVYTKKVSL